MKAQPGSAEQLQFCVHEHPCHLCWGPAHPARAGEVERLQGAADTAKVGQDL